MPQIYPFKPGVSNTVIEDAACSCHDNCISKQQQMLSRERYSWTNVIWQWGWFSK